MRRGPGHIISRFEARACAPLSVPMENPESTVNPAAEETGNPGPANSVLKIQSLTGRAIVAAFILLVLFYLLNILHPFFAALAWAAILATALHPVYLRIQQRIRRPRLASALTCLLLTVLVVVPGIFLLGKLAAQSVLAYRTLEQKATLAHLGKIEWLRQSALFTWFQARLTALGLPPIRLDDLTLRALKLLSSFLVGNSSAFFGGFTNFVFNFVVTFVVLYLLLLRGTQILDDVNSICGVTPEWNARFLRRFRATSLASLEGSLVSAVLRGAFGGFTFYLFRLPAPVLWGAVMAFLSLVPLVGTALVWAPVVIYLLAEGEIARALGMLAVFLVAITVVDNFVKPMLMQRHAEIHPLWIFLGVVGGIHYFGLLGFVLGPLVITAFQAIFSILKTERTHP